jgi:hypothetical protein
MFYEATPSSSKRGLCNMKDELLSSKLFLRKLNYEKLTENRQEANDDVLWTILKVLL